MAALLLSTFFLAEATWRHDQLSLTSNDTNVSAGDNVGVLILKDARTASSYLALELNKRGIHIQQESLLNWERDLEVIGVDSTPYMTKNARLGWVEQSLLRPMPKNPYTMEMSCYPGEKKWLNGLEQAKMMDDMEDSRKQACSLYKSGDCSPPFKGETCLDKKGCFAFYSLQKECLHEDIEAKAHGLAFNFQEELGTGNTNNNQRLMYNADLLNEVLSNLEQKGNNIKFFAQTRSNIIRWGISKAFHTLDIQHGGVPFENGQYVVSADRKVTFKSDPEKFFHHVVTQIERIMSMSLSVKDDAKVIFYEDIARSLDNSIDAIASYLEVDTKTSGSNFESSNTQNQHADMPKEYITNFDEVLSKLEQFPCLHRQMLHPHKDDTFILPLKRKGNNITMDMSKDCPVADRDTYLRTIDAYLAAYTGKSSSDASAAMSSEESITRSNFSHCHD